VSASKFASRLLVQGHCGEPGKERHVGQREQLGVGNVVWRTKSNYSAPADTHIVDEIKRWQAVITGVGD